MPEFTLFSQFTEALFLLKAVFLIILFLFALFSFVVLNQTNVMNKIITEAHFSPILKIIAILNLVVVISLFLTAVVIL